MAPSFDTFKIEAAKLISSISDLEKLAKELGQNAGVALVNRPGDFEAAAQIVIAKWKLAQSGDDSELVKRIRKAFDDAVLINYYDTARQKAGFPEYSGKPAPQQSAATSGGGGSKPPALAPLGASETAEASETPQGEDVGDGDKCFEPSKYAKGKGRFFIINNEEFDKPNEPRMCAPVDQRAIEDFLKKLENKDFDVLTDKPILLQAKQILNDGSPKEGELRINKKTAEYFIDLERTDKPKIQLEFGMPKERQLIQLSEGHFIYQPEGHIFKQLRNEQQIKLQNGKTVELVDGQLQLANFERPILSVQSELMRVRKELNKSEANYDYFCCFVMSHGLRKEYKSSARCDLSEPEQNQDAKKSLDAAEPGESYFVDKAGNEMTIEELVSFFKADKCPGLKGKPKLFFIDACRGRKDDTGVSLPSGPGMTENIKKKTHKTIPLESDMFVFYATPPGYPSYFLKYPTEDVGSHFIHSLCKVLNKNYAQSDIMEIATIVQGKVSEIDIKIDGDNKDYKQMPYVTSTLRKQFFFK